MAAQCTGIAHIVVTYKMKIDDALEKATLASFPIMTPSGSLDLMMRWMAAVTSGRDPRATQSTLPPSSCAASFK